MLPILSAASTVGELERAWRLLIQHIGRAQEKLDHNFKKYKQEELPLLPATTDPQLYEALRSTWEPEAVMTQLYSQIPSMMKLLSEEECSLFQQGRNLCSMLASPITLKAVFLDGQLEAHPLEVYYNKHRPRLPYSATAFFHPSTGQSSPLQYEFHRITRTVHIHL